MYARKNVHRPNNLTNMKPKTSPTGKDAQCQFPLPLGERVALSGPLTRDTWLGHPSRSGPWLPGSQCPGTVYQGGGAFALRAPLSTTGELGRRLRRFICASEWSPQRYPEADTGTPGVVSQTKQNKTKQKQTKQAVVKVRIVGRPLISLRITNQTCLRRRHVL